MQDMYLSVIVPAYNEARNFSKGHIAQMLDYLRRQPYRYEVIIVDDGSDDNSLEKLRQLEARQPQITVMANPHQGKALTVKTGMLKAQGKHRLYTDFDQSTPIAEVEKLLQKRDEGYDIVVGSREVAGAKREEEPWYRHMMGRVFNWVVRLFTVRGIRDTQCGFKLFSDVATKQLFPKLSVTTQAKPDAFTGAFDVELLYLGQKMGLTIAEVPVHWHHEETQRVNPVKDSLRMFMEVLRIRWHDLFKGYNS